jgi:hypothetical protein
MPSRRISCSQSFDEKVFELLDDSWRTVAEVRRLLGVSQALGVARALDRLWEAGRIEKDAVDIVGSAGRKGGGGELRFLKLRRKRETEGTLASTQ